MPNEVWNYLSALKHLFKVGGSVSKQVYNCEPLVDMEVTYIRFDEPLEFGHYVAFSDKGYLLGYGNCVSKIEAQLGV